MEQDKNSSPTQLPAGQFAALRLWAVNFEGMRRGIAVWPFTYTTAQEQRLKAIERAVPTRARLIWVSVTALLWFAIGFMIAMIPLIPFISMQLSTNHSLVVHAS